MSIESKIRQDLRNETAEALREVGRLSVEMERLKRVLSRAIGHSNCYCEKCNGIASQYWKPDLGDKRNDGEAK